MLEVPLHPGLPDGRWACLRPLCGHDEATVDDHGDMAATHLVDRLLIAADGTSVGPGSAWHLAVTDRDRLLIALYRHHYGDRVEGTAECRACRTPFDLAFAVDDLTGRLDRGRDNDNETEGWRGPDERGVFTLADGRRFRLPTPEDQRCVAGLDPETAAAELLGRCLVQGELDQDRGSLESALAQAAPVLDLDLDARCPECGTDQTVRFDIRVHLLGALASERVWLRREVHTIAAAYGWSLQEILALPREDRRNYVELIQADRPARARPSHVQSRGLA